MDRSKMRHSQMGYVGQWGVGAGGHAGHWEDDHHAMMIADFRMRCWAVLVLTVPVMALSPMIRHWLLPDHAGGGK